MQERHRIEAEDGGGTLATWDTRYAGLRPWYPGISLGNFEIIWPGVTQLIWFWFLSNHLGLIEGGCPLCDLSAGISDGDTGTRHTASMKNREHFIGCLPGKDKLRLAARLDSSVLLSCVSPL